jgi:hypothetical protein
MLTIVWILAGSSFAAFLFIAAGRPGRRNRSVEILQSQIWSIDLAAFQNLSDRSNDQFLRHRLSAAAFRKAQHLRARAMMSYLLAVGHNAAIFIRMGEMAKQSSDRQVAEAGQLLIDTALQTRILVLRIYPRLLALWLLPTLASVDFGPIISRYDLLMGELTQLLRLQRSTAASAAFAATS